MTETRMDTPQPANVPPPVSARRAEELTAWHARMAAGFDKLANRPQKWGARCYQSWLKHYFSFHIPPGAKVLEVGCHQGDLLASLAPAVGVGVDISGAAIAQARQRHARPELTFIAGAIEEVALPQGPFDYIILADTLAYLYDIEAVFQRLRPLCHPRTRILISHHSHLWRPILRTAELLGLKQTQPRANWLAPGDVRNLLQLAGFDVVQRDQRILLPVSIPLVSTLLNRVCAPLWPWNHACLVNLVVVRPVVAMPEATGVSVICACRNEAGNIAEICRRFPKFDGPAELIFVEGNSKDDTWGQCQQAQRDFPQLDITCYKQPGKGKGDAVRVGFAQAKYPVLMILDADMTVPPEDLPATARALVQGRGEFINGSRFVYAMEARAMRFANMIANKFFGMAFTWLMSQPVKDTLCGTKVLLKSDWDRICANRAYFGEFDPFGDFDMLFGAAKLGLKIIDYPIRYRERVYGETNIQRWRHGVLLLGMCGVALRKLKMR
jgi:ubiquinone/menaquinone biosynthesis C-methylase UbiE